MIRLAALLMLCAVTALAGEDAAPAAHPDLKLEASGPRQAAAGANVELTIHLVNTSKDKGVQVIKPGDGSESGWREPHVFYTAEARQADGTWKALPRQGVGRCGMYNPKWENDVVELKAGAKLELKDWLVPVERTIDLKNPGTYRVQVHYSYREGRNCKGPARTAAAPPPVPESMKGVKAFEVVSEKIEFKVVAAPPAEAAQK